MAGGRANDNVHVPELDPAAVIEAVSRDPRLRAFTGLDEEFLSRSDGQYWRSGGTVLPSAVPCQSPPARADPAGTSPW
jgi:hypothetical protein